MRIKKQQKIESHLESITSDLKSVTLELEHASERILASFIGEKSRPKLRFSYLDKLKSKAVFHISNRGGTDPAYDMAGSIYFSNYGFPELDVPFGPLTLPANAVNRHAFTFPLDMKVGTKVVARFSSTKEPFIR